MVTTSILQILKLCDNWCPRYLWGTYSNVSATWNSTLGPYMMCSERKPLWFFGWCQAGKVACQANKMACKPRISFSRTTLVTESRSDGMPHRGRKDLGKIIRNCWIPVTSGACSIFGSWKSITELVETSCGTAAARLKARWERVDKGSQTAGGWNVLNRRPETEYNLWKCPRSTYVDWYPSDGSSFGRGSVHKYRRVD
jgi:hypothetical protein